MSQIYKEVEAVQNPALGAVLLWRFTVGYAEKASGNPTPLLLLFIVLPILLHEETSRVLLSTQVNSGLRAFAGKFSASARSEQDILLSLHTRTLVMRQLTAESLALATACQLVGVEISGNVFYLSKTTPNATIPEEVRPLLKGAEKLGKWCAEVSLHEVSNILKIAF